MELVVAILALAVTVGIIFYVTRDKDSSPVKEALVGETAKVEVSEVKVTEKVKLPTKTKLAAMTKAQIEQLGREFEIDLDKRKTKDNMIAELKAAHKKL